MASVPLPRKMALMPPPEEAVLIMQQLHETYDHDNSEFEVILSADGMSLDVVKFQPGLYFRQALIDTHLAPLAHVESEHKESYALPPSPPVKSAAAEPYQYLFYSFNDLKTFMECNRILSDTAFVVHPIYQDKAGGLIRGLILAPLKSKHVLLLDARRMEVDLFKCHWIFQDLMSTGIYWNYVDVQVLKSTYGIRCRQILVLQDLLFPEANRNCQKNLDKTAQILIGQPKMEEWASLEYPNRNEVDRDEFLAIERIRWLWYISRRLLRFWPPNLLQAALEKSRIINNERAGIGPTSSHFPWEEVMFQELEDEEMTPSSRLRVWRGLEALEQALDFQSLFPDATLNAADDLPPNPSDAEWTAFCSTHLPLLSTSQREEVYTIHQSQAELVDKATRLEYSTYSETLLSLSASSGDTRVLGPISETWRLRGEEINQKSSAISETYRFGARHRDCSGQNFYHQAQEMSYSVFYRSMPPLWLNRLLHRFCMPQNIRPGTSLLMGPDHQLKQCGDFTVCCRGHIFKTEVTLINLPYGGLVVFVRRGDFDRTSVQSQSPDA